MSRVTSHESRATPSVLWTVVPVRGIAAGKSRLAAVLDATARAALNRRLLEHTLSVVAAWSGGLDRCAVVSSCREALALAARLGAVAVDEGPEAGGLNAAAALGREYAGAHGASSALVLACDLPRLNVEALAAMAGAAASERHMILAPDRHGTGTNALLVSARAPFDFQFGEASCAKHRALAAARGWPVELCLRSELEFDLDTPADLARWTETAAEADRRRML